MKNRWIGDMTRFPQMNTTQLREAFLIDDLDEEGAVQLNYVDLDRAIVGLAIPLESPLPLPCHPELRADFFTERRELGVLNIGGGGVARVNGQSYTLENLDCLYIGRGNPEVVFESKNPASPGVFYLLSYPAHCSYPTTLVRSKDADATVLGNEATCNRRTVCKYIYVNGAKSCQLVMGVTHLQEGSAWNTMPAHTHMRRSEIYMYFNLSQGARVFHLMGPPEETRHIVMRNREAVVSPGWSIHSGVGTEAYSFCWSMGGENQDYADMDPAPLENMR
jgi:4-deoxy-L-threo-5-hexosulose-uronate ketol-isomerase